MDAPPEKEKRDPAGIAPVSNTRSPQDRFDRRLQASLARRLNRVAAISEVMPCVLAVTFAQGISHSQRSLLAKWNGDKQ